MESATGIGSPSCKAAALRHALRNWTSASRCRPDAAASLPDRSRDATSGALAAPGLACGLSWPSPLPALASIGAISQLPATAVTNAVDTGTACALADFGTGDEAYGPSPPRKLIMPRAPATTPTTSPPATNQPVFLTMDATVAALQHAAGGTVRTGADGRFLRRARAARPLLLLQAQQAPLHLAGGGHGQRLDEFD